jgi:hypothetical protein
MFYFCCTGGAICRASNFSYKYIFNLLPSLMILLFSDCHIPLRLGPYLLSLFLNAYSKMPSILKKLVSETIQKKEGRKTQQSYTQSIIF